MIDYFSTFFFESFCVINDDIWMSARDYNGLFKGNLKNGDLQFIGCFPEESPLKQRLHYGKAIYKNEKIYFIPLESKFLHVYNMNTHLIEFYSIGKKVNRCYASAVCSNNEIYMISTRTTELLKYHIDNDLFEFLDSSSFQSNVKFGYFHGYYFYNNDLFLSLSQKNILRRINVLDNQITDYFIGEKSYLYQIVAGKEDIIYLINKDKPEVICWNISHQKVIDVINLEYGILLNSWQYGNIVLGNAHLNEGITVLNLSNLKADKIFIQNSKKIYNNTGYEIQNSFIYNDDIYIVWEGDGGIYSLKEKKEILRFSINNNELKELKDEMQCHLGKLSENVLEESDVFNLNDLIAFVKK